jgi:hypothetical protein
MCVVIKLKKATRSSIGWLWIIFCPFGNVAFTSSADNVIDEFEFGWPENESGTRTTLAVRMWVGRWCGRNKGHDKPHEKRFKLAL